MGNFVHFWQVFALVFVFQIILSFGLQKTCSLGLPFILSWYRSKYRYLTNLWANCNQIRCVCPNMGIWCLAQNSAIFVRPERNLIYEFRRPLATSRARTILLSGMFRLFDIIEPKYEQIWALLHHGHLWAPESAIFSKVWSFALVHWLTTILK